MRPSLGVVVALACIGCAPDVAPPPQDVAFRSASQLFRCDDNYPYESACFNMYQDTVTGYWTAARGGKEVGPIPTSAIILDHRHAYVGYLRYAQYARSEVCYYNTAISDWQCGWIWATFTPTTIHTSLDSVPDPGVAGYLPERADWVAIFEVHTYGQHRLSLRGENDISDPVADTLEFTMVDTAAVPAPPALSRASGVERTLVRTGDGVAMRLRIGGVLISELRLVCIRRCEAPARAAP